MLWERRRRRTGQVKGRRIVHAGVDRGVFLMQLETERMGSKDGGGSGQGQREWTRWRKWACHELAEVRILYCQRYRVEL